MFNRKYSISGVIAVSNSFDMPNIPKFIAGHRGCQQHVACIVIMTFLTVLICTLLFCPRCQLLETGVYRLGCLFLFVLERSSFHVFTIIT